jgi:hypothetical protein
MALLARIRSVAVLATIAGLAGAAPAPAAPAAPLAAPAARANTISVSVFCLSIGHGRAECQAGVSGARGTVTYNWNPTPYAGSGDYVLIYCTAYRNKKVTLTVTDSYGGWGYGETTFYCGDAD